jgi:hypothetical protein
MTEFKTADELGILEWEREGLVSFLSLPLERTDQVVRKFLETGEVRWP